MSPGTSLPEIGSTRRAAPHHSRGIRRRRVLQTARGQSWLLPQLCYECGMSRLTERLGEDLIFLGTALKL